MTKQEALEHLANSMTNRLKHEYYLEQEKGEQMAEVMTAATEAPWHVLAETNPIRFWVCKT